MSAAVEPVQIGPASLRGHVPLRTSEFARVNREGQVQLGRQVVMKWIPAPDGETRLGIVVSRRYSRSAVTRNRARRLIREAFRLLRNGITQPVWLVVISRKYLHGSKLQKVQREYADLLTKAGVFGGTEPS